LPFLPPLLVVTAFPSPYGAKDIWPHSLAALNANQRRLVTKRRNPLAESAARAEQISGERIGSGEAVTRR
jgi:hypothetical protein